MIDKGIVGLSIALVDDQRIVWQQGFGYADGENKIAAAPETGYRAGSISKQCNAMAVMTLVETSKMNIDRPLVNYLPAFSIKSRFGNTDSITPRTIMTHHSGLPDDWIDGLFGTQPMPFTRLVNMSRMRTWPIRPYSNLPVTLLGQSVQNVSGREYDRFLDQCLLKPMGMTHSRFETRITGDTAAKSYHANLSITVNFRGTARRAKDRLYPQTQASCRIDIYFVVYIALLCLCNFPRR